MTDITTLRTDRTAEVEGAWTEVVIFDEVVEMKVARWGNREYDRLHDRLMKPHLRTLRMGKKLPPEVAQKIEVECVASTILLDWRGLTNGGEPFPYSVENATLLLTEYPDVLDAVRMAAFDAERFRVETQEESEGNSAAA